MRRNKSLEPLMFPQVVVFVPELLTRNPTVSDAERRRVANAGATPEIHHIVVDSLNGQRVLDAGVAVDDHRHVVHER